VRDPRSEMEVRVYGPYSELRSSNSELDIGASDDQLDLLG